MIPQLVGKLNQFTISGASNTIATVTLKLNLNILSDKLIKNPAQFLPALNVGGLNNGPCLCDDSNAAATYDYTFSLSFASPSTGAAAALVSPSTVSFSVPNDLTPIVYAIDPTDYSLSQIVGSTSIDGQLFQILGSQFLVLNALVTTNTVLTSQIAAYLAALGVPSTNAGLAKLLALPATDVATGIAFDPSTDTFTVSFNTVPASSPAPPAIPVDLSTLFDPVTITTPAFSAAHYLTFVPSCNKDKCDSYWVVTDF